jgi:hypothetical protein
MTRFAQMSPTKCRGRNRLATDMGVALHVKLLVYHLMIDVTSVCQLQEAAGIDQGYFLE